MKYRALRFAGRLFLSGRGWRGTAPRGNASLPTIAAGGRATGGRGLCMEWAHSCAPLHWRGGAESCPPVGRVINPQSGLPYRKPGVEARSADTSGSLHLSLGTNLRSGLPNREPQLQSTAVRRYPCEATRSAGWMIVDEATSPQVSALRASTRGLRLGNPLRGLFRTRVVQDAGCAGRGLCRRALFSFWGFFINLGGYLGYTYSELILNWN